jgi:hypothetical protein
VSSKSDFLIYFFNQQSTKIHNKACRYAGAVQAHRCVYCVGLLLIWLLTCVSHPGPESSYLIIGSYIFIAGLSVFVRGWGRRAGVECPFSGWVTYHCTALNLLRETEEIMGGHEKQNNSGISVYDTHWSRTETLLWLLELWHLATATFSSGISFPHLDRDRWLSSSFKVHCKCHISFLYPGKNFKGT